MMLAIAVVAHGVGAAALVAAMAVVLMIFVTAPDRGEWEDDEVV